MDEVNQQNQGENGAISKIHRRISWRQSSEKDATFSEGTAGGDVSEEICEVTENLEEYIETIEDKDIEYALKNSEMFKRLCGELLRAFQNLERKEAAFERLLNVIKKLSIKSDCLLNSVKAWLPKRKQFLFILKEDIKTMNVITKVCNTGRLVCSIIESVSLIGGLIIRKSDSSSASIAFDIANGFGVLGFTSSITELYNWKTKLERLIKEFQEDQDLLTPIHEWFQANNELEEAMKEIFPFEITKHVVREFDKAMHKQLNQAELLRMVLWPILQENQQRFRDTTLIRNLIAFTFCPAATDWCRWIVLRQHKANLDIEAMLLQLINPQRFASNQNFAMMEGGSQNPIPISALGRIGLNMVTMYDSINILRSNTIVEELTQLQSHLQEEMSTLQQISKFISIRKPK